VFSVLSGLGLVLFVEPPFRWFVGGDKYSGDRRVLALVVALLGVFMWMMAVPSLRRFWELLPLEAFDYALVIGAVLVWIVVQRYVWRARLFERFLHLEAMVDLSDDWLMEELKGK
jgi:cation-transporting ATPase E